MSQYLPFLYWLSWTVLDPVGLRFPKGSFTSSVRVNAAYSALIGNNGIILQECIPVGCVLPDSVTVSPATHAPCHASPSPPYTPPLCRTCHPPHMSPCHACPLPRIPYHACPLPNPNPTMHTPSLYMPFLHAGPFATHAPWTEGMTDACENITFLQLLLWMVDILECWLYTGPNRIPEQPVHRDCI